MGGQKKWGNEGGVGSLEQSYSFTPLVPIPSSPQPPPPSPLSPPINRSENMSDWIFSSKSSGLGFCWSTLCQHLLKQTFNAPALAIFLLKYGRNRQELVQKKERVREKKKRSTRQGEKDGGQKPPVFTDPTVCNFNQLYARPLLFLLLCLSVWLIVSLSCSLCLTFSLPLAA